MCLIKTIPIKSVIPIMTYRDMGVVVRGGRMTGIPVIGSITDGYTIDGTSKISEPARLYSKKPEDFGYHSTFLNYVPIVDIRFVPNKVRTLREGIEVVGAYSVLIMPEHMMYTDFEDITSNYFFLNPTYNGLGWGVLYTPLLWDKVPSTLWSKAQEVSIHYSGEMNVLMKDGTVQVFDTRNAVIRYEDALRMELKRNKKAGRLIAPLWQRNSIKQFLEEKR